MLGEPAPPSPGAGPLSLRANFSWTVAGNVVYAATQWGVVVALAKLLDSEAVGRFALALAIASPIMLLAGLNLRAVQATDARRAYAFGHYLALRLVTTAAALALIGAVALAFPPPTAGVILLVGVAKAVEAISDVVYGLFQLEERLDRMAWSMLLRGPLALVAMVAAVAVTGELAWAAAALVAAWAAVLAGHDVPRAAVTVRHRGELRPRWAPAMLGRLAWLAAPLGAVLGLISLSANVPRYAVERYLGESELGVFAGIGYLIVAGTTVVNAMGQAAAPRLAKQHAAGDTAAFRRLLGRLVALAVALGIAGLAVAAVAGRPLLRLLYSEEYARLDVLLWVVAAGGLLFVATFLGYGITAARYFRSQLPLFGATTAAVAATAVALVPSGGLVGAAQATIAGAVIQIAGSAAILAHATRRREAHVPS